MSTFTTEDRIAAQKALEAEKDQQCCGKCDGCDKEKQLPKVKSLAELANEFEDSYNEKLGRSGVRWAGD